MYSGWVLILRHVLKGAEKNLQNINVVPQYNTNSTYLNVCRQTPTLEMFRCALQGLKPSQVLLLPISQQEVHGNHPLPPPCHASHSSRSCGWHLETNFTYFREIS